MPKLHRQQNMLQSFHRSIWQKKSNNNLTYKKINLLIYWQYHQMKFSELHHVQCHLLEWFIHSISLLPASTSVLFHICLQQLLTTFFRSLSPVHFLSLNVCQPALAGTPVKNFTSKRLQSSHVADNTFKLGRRPWSSPQWCYLDHPLTIDYKEDNKKHHHCSIKLPSAVNSGTFEATAALNGRTMAQ